MKINFRLLFLLLFLNYPFPGFSQESAADKFTYFSYNRDAAKADNTGTYFSDYLQNLFSYGNENSGRVNRIPITIRMIKRWESCVSYKLSGLLLSEKYCENYIQRSVLIFVFLQIPVIIFPFNTFW